VLGKLFKCATNTPDVSFFDFTVTGLGNRGSCNQNHVGGHWCRRPVSPKNVPQSPLGSVAIDRAAYAPTRNHSDSKKPRVRRQQVPDEQPVRKPLPFSISPIEVRLSTKALKGFEALI
jgi:hypothetical protein